MENPFLKRAAEFLRDPEAFLAIVSPEPARVYLAPHANDALYDRLVQIRGTPGSGKTTLSRLFAYPTLATLLRNKDLSSYGAVLGTLVECRAIVDDQPAILSCRLPMETDYRTIWEFPYDEELKLRLTIALLQSRAVLGWIRALRESAVDLSTVRIKPRSDATAALSAIGAESVDELVARARTVEERIYKLVGALVTPPLESVSQDLQDAYHPFDVIEGIAVGRGSSATDSVERTLRPLVILDDTHVLHPTQLKRLQAWLARREVRVSRWILSRIDVMHPTEMFAAVSAPEPQPELPGITSGRDTLDIMLQSAGKDRAKFRARFREIAKDISSRYVRQMPVFNTRKLESLSDLLETEAQSIADSKIKRLSEEVSGIQQKFKITASRLKELTDLVESYRPQAGDLDEDVRLVLVRILLHRYMKRIPQQGVLYAEVADPDPSRPLRVDAQLSDAARLALFHEFDRPYYYGMEVLCDCGSENTEQFLHLAACLVDAIAARLIRGTIASLDARTQHKLLRDKAKEIMGRWDFPERQAVEQVVTGIATECLRVSLLPNAWIGAGANAYGIPQSEFETLAASYPALARVLHFGLAYNALALNPRYPCKNKEWCLIELGGIPILRFGLTLKRGGFIEGSIDELKRMVGEK
jgi:hypothetical protein